MRQNQQTTLRAPVTLSGCGVHSGDDVRLVLHPAESNHGIVFLRTGLPGGRDRLIDARHVAVSATELCTVIGERESGAVATIEHLMSALYGAGVDNVLVEIDGVEVPILDGSAAPFVDAIDQVGVVLCNAPRRYLKVMKPVRATQGKAFAELRPDDAFRLDVEIDFGDDIIGRQRRAADDDEPGLPPRGLAGPHLRLHARRRAALEGRLRARRLAREHRRGRRRRHRQPGRPALSGRVRPPQDARRHRRSRRSPARRCLAPTGPSAAAIASTSRCSRPCSPTARTIPSSRAAPAARPAMPRSATASRFRLSRPIRTEASVLRRFRASASPRRRACPIFALRLSHHRPRWGWREARP